MIELPIALLSKPGSKDITIYLNYHYTLDSTKKYKEDSITIVLDDLLSKFGAHEYK